MNNPALKILVEMYDEQWAYLKQLCELEVTAENAFQVQVGVAEARKVYEEYVQGLHNCFSLLDAIVSSKLETLASRVGHVKATDNTPIELTEEVKQ